MGFITMVNLLTKSMMFQMKKMLMTFERKILRKVSGLVIKYN